MKKLLTVLLAALLILGGFAGVRNAAAEGSDWKTLGDIWDFESPGYGCENNQYVRLFQADGVYYRADVTLTEEQFQQLMDIDIFDPQAGEKEKALLAELPIEHLYDLSAVLLPQEALDSLAGITGQELLDMGFVPQGSYGFSEAEKLSWASLDKGPFEYQVEFVEYVDADEDPNVAEVIRPLTVKAVKWEGNLSQYAMAADFDIQGGPSLEDYEAMFATPERVFYPIPQIPLADSPFATLADVFDVLNKANDEGATPRYSSSLTDTMYVVAFEKEDASYRVEAEVPTDVAAQLDAIDFFDEQRDEKQEALLGPLPVVRVGDLSAIIPAQEELDALIGMTGQDLLDLGFEYGMGYSFWEATDFYLTRGLVEYVVTFNEKVPEMEDYDAVLDELFRSMTVKKVVVDGLSSLCSDPDLFWIPGADEAQPVGEDGLILSDFTVTCIDGSAFTLSEALKDHELVLINLFFTNCPPCKLEFPFLQEAWSQNQDKVAVVALSPDAADTDEVLQAYAQELGLTFPIAHEEGTGLYDRYVTEGFPTTMLVDRTGRIAMIECGAYTATQDFLDLFDEYTGEDYDPSLSTYTVYCYGAEGYEDVTGVVVTFCTDTTCVPVTSADQGAAIFLGTPVKYHVKIMTVPEGWQLSGSAEWDTELYGQIFWVPFTKVGQ